MLLIALRDKKHYRPSDFLTHLLGLILYAANNLRSHIHPEAQSESEKIIDDCIKKLDSFLRNFVADQEIIGGSMFGSTKLERADQELKVKRFFYLTKLKTNLLLPSVILLFICLITLIGHNAIFIRQVIQVT